MSDTGDTKTEEFFASTLIMYNRGERTLTETRVISAATFYAPLPLGIRVSNDPQAINILFKSMSQAAVFETSACAIAQADYIDLPLISALAA